MNQRFERARGRAIVTHARSWQALATIRSLGRRGIEVIAADEYKLTPGGASKYAKETIEYPSFANNPDGFIDSLADAAQRFAPKDERIPFVLMPIHQESYLIAKNRDRFPDRLLIPLADTERFELVRDKLALAELARETDVQIPETRLIRSEEELQSAVHLLPGFLKLSVGASGVGIIQVNNWEELIAGYRQLRFESESTPMLLQESVPGGDYCFTALFDRGQLLASMSYRNMLSFPLHHGPGVLRETVDAPAMKKAAEQLLGKVMWHGMIQLDFRWTGDATDMPLLLEANPRFFGGLYQAIESGVDYPWLLFQLATGKHVKPPESVQIGLKTAAPVTSVLAMLSEILDQDVELKTLGDAWQLARQQMKEGQSRKALELVMTGLEETVDWEGRLEHVREVLQREADKVFPLMTEDDPSAILGLIYPLAVFLRHGKINTSLITGTGFGEDR